MKKIKYFFMTAFAFLLGILPAMAEGESGGGNAGITAVNTQIDTWVGAAKSAIEGWIDKLGPLFLVGVAIVLLLLAWAIFAKVTKKARG